MYANTVRENGVNPNNKPTFAAKIFKKFLGYEQNSINAGLRNIDDGSNYRPGWRHLNQHESEY